MSNVTRKDVAKIAEVSEATVSRVFSNHHSVKAETKEKVLKVASQLNYYPNVLAQNFAKRKSGNIGVVLPYIPSANVFSNYFFAEVLQGIGEVTEKNHYNMVLLFQHESNPMDYEQYFLRHEIDGCLILGAKHREEEIRNLEKLHKRNLPFCMVNQHFSSQEFSEVDANHEDGSHQVIQHLYEQGCKKIAFLNGPLVFSNSSDRLAGYKKACKEWGLPLLEEFIHYGDYSRTSGYQKTDSILTLDMDAIYCANDRMAIGVMRRLEELEIQPGKDIALVGYDYSDLSRLVTPTLTSVEVPFREMGKHAAEKVLNDIAHSKVEYKQVKLATKLIINESSLLV
ncbi:putative transcriptional regulator [Bacillus sp. TS-2]|nr:putative transcriptional regulator [Bacillus sp. TS-2]